MVPQSRRTLLSGFGAIIVAPIIVRNPALLMPVRSIIIDGTHPADLADLLTPGDASNLAEVRSMSIIGRRIIYR